MKLYRLLLRLLPRVFRERHGDAMGEAFEQAARAARRRGSLAVLSLWWREVRDLARTGARLRRGRRGVTDTNWRGLMGRRGGSRRLDGLGDDLRYALRSLARRPAFAAFAAVTIGLGVGATTAIFSALDSVSLRPLPFPGGERVVSVWARMGTNSRVLLSPSVEQIDAWSTGLDDLVEGLEVFRQSSATLTGLGQARVVQTAAIRPSFHDFVEAPPVMG